MELPKAFVDITRFSRHFYIFWCNISLFLAAKIFKFSRQYHILGFRIYLLYFHRENRPDHMNVSTKDLLKQFTSAIVCALSMHKYSLIKKCVERVDEKGTCYLIFSADVFPATNCFMRCNIVKQQKHFHTHRIVACLFDCRCFFGQSPPNIWIFTAYTIHKHMHTLFINFFLPSSFHHRIGHPPKVKFQNVKHILAEH